MKANMTHTVQTTEIVEQTTTKMVLKKFDVTLEEASGTDGAINIVASSEIGPRYYIARLCLNPEGKLCFRTYGGIYERENFDCDGGGDIVVSRMRDRKEGGY